MSIVGFIVYDGIQTPVIWADGNSSTPPSKLNFTGGDRGIATGINSLGQIVGTIFYGGIPTPVIWADGKPTTLPMKLNYLDGISGLANGINSLGQIVGVITYGGNITPVIWDNSNPNTPPSQLIFNGAIEGRATGINNLGQIVGFIKTDLVSRTPVIWANGEPTTIPTTLNSAGNTYGYAAGINNLGQIVGIINYEVINQSPVIWANGDSTSTPSKLSYTGGNKGTANGINSLGQIVGNVYNENVNGSNTDLPVIWANSNSSTLPTTLNFTGGTGGTANGIADPPIISNICFPAGTPITTDQGRIPIELIDTQLHTIHQQPILHVTRTVTLDKYLISIAPHALGRNLPHTKTLMSKDHKIAFEGQLVPAYRFLDFSDQVKKVTYRGETLYNILLPNYSTMLINNLECETLHPENIIAKLYTTNYTDSERALLEQQWNKSLTQRDNKAYQAVVNRLTTK